STLYRSTETICLLQSPFPGLPTCVRSRPRVPPMPIGLGFLPLVEPFRALPRVVVPSFCLSRFHLPASLDSTGITPLLRYYGGSVTSRVQFFGPLLSHERCSFPGWRSLIHIAPTSDHSISNHPMHSYRSAHCSRQG